MNSIFGPDICSEESNENLAEYAKKTYVDVQVGRRFKRSGGQMTGNINMRGNLIKGLPTSYSPQDYNGDEAISWRQSATLDNDSLRDHPTVEQINTMITESVSDRSTINQVAEMIQNANGSLIIIK